MRRVILGSIWLASVLAAVSCGSSGTGDGPDDVVSVTEVLGDASPDDVVVETVLSKSSVAAGEPVDVTCKVSLKMKLLSLPVEVVVQGEGEPSVVEAGPVTLEKSGEYDLACRTKGEPVMQDATPSHLKVTVGKAVKVTAEVEPSEVNAGSSATVTCTAFDAYGNSAKVKPGVEVEPSDGVEIDGQEVTAGKPGTYSVTCIVEKGVEAVADTLVVKVGVPKLFVAKVDPASVEAGGSATVSCDITDANGNLFAADWKVDAPADVKVQGKSISATKAGKHKIKCAPTSPAGGEELVAADFTVTPGAPVDMKIYAKPVKDHFVLADQVTIKHELVDQYENIVGDGDIEPIVVEPPTGMDLLPEKIDKFVFNQEGYYHASVKAKDLPFSGELDFACDGTGPKITITYPPRAQTFSGPTSLVVTGTVQDTVSGVAMLKVNGEDVEVQPDGGFSKQMTMVHGMNLISVEAEDGFANSWKSFRSAFYSTKYLPADSIAPAAAQVSKAILAYLSQEFIDDGDHSDPPDDLATIVEIVMAGLDIKGMLPQEGIPVLDKATLYITNVTFDKPQVTLQSVDGGIHLLMTIPNLQADIKLEVCIDLPFVGETCQSSYGIIFVEKLKLDAFLFVGIGADGLVDASLGPIDVELEGLNVDIQGILGSLFDPLVTTLVNTLKDALISQFTSQGGEQLPAMVEDALNQLAQGQEIELPPLIGSGDPTKLLLSLSFEQLQFSFDGLVLGLKAALTAFGKVAHTPAGVLLRDGCMGTENQDFVLPKTNEMNAAIAADFVNEALFSIWWSGALTLDLSAEDLGDIDVTEYGIENLSVKVDLYYAPILKTCGADGKLMLQLGDGFVHAKFFMMNMNWDIQIFLFLEADAVLKLVQNDETGETEIGIEIGELKTAEIDVDAVGDDLKGKEAMVIDLFKGVLLPQLMDSLLGSLGSFAVPGIDLSTLDPSIPEGTMISVDLQELYLENGYLVIGGKLK
ncbi:MAG: hypothetical protein FJ109_07300 [Deltaproteobacteria bacterium]|nr:hypothetical protein [Deltaproteobacteria bacterium]